MVDPTEYKATLSRTLAGEESTLGRPDDFIGDSFRFSSHSKKTESSKHKFGAPQSPQQYRTDDWHGSPVSTKRGSFGIKNAVPIAPPGLDQLDRQSPTSTTSSVERPLTVSPCRATQSITSPKRVSPRRLSPKTRNSASTNASLRPPLSPKRRESPTNMSAPISKSVMKGVTRHSLGGSSSHHRRTFNQIDEVNPPTANDCVTKVVTQPLADGPSSHHRRTSNRSGVRNAQKPNDSIIQGVKRHSLEGSSPYHRYPHAMDDANYSGMTELERAKAMLRKSSTNNSRLRNSIDDCNLSGNDGHSSLDSSTRSEVYHAPPPRPTPTDPLDLSNRSDTYAVNISTYGSRTPAGTRRKTVALGSSVFGSSTALRKAPRRPIRSNSPGTLRHKTKFARPIPPLAPSVAEMKKLQGTPINEKEKVDRAKFVAAFSAFEGDGIGSLPLSVPKGISTATKRSTDISPSTGASVPSVSHPKSNKISKKSRIENLDGAVSQLRQFMDKDLLLAPKDDRSEEHASVIMKMMRYLKKRPDSCTTPKTVIQGSENLLRIVRSLRNNGIVDTHIQPEEMLEVYEIEEDLNPVIESLESGDPCRIELEICARVLGQISPCSPSSLKSMESVLERLESVLPEISEENISTVEQFYNSLKMIVFKIYRNEEEELANIIRNLEDDELDSVAEDGELHELTRVLVALDNLTQDDSTHAVDEIDDLGDTGGSSHSNRSWAARTPSISPKTWAKRNFVVSKASRAKSLKLSLKPLDDSAHTAKSEHEEELRAIISNLRKVVVPKKDVTKSEQQASEIMEMIKLLRRTGLKTAGAEELNTMVRDLREKGIILSNLGPNKINELSKAIEHLKIIKDNILDSQQVRKQIQSSLKQLKHLTPTCADSADTIDNEIGRLKSVKSELRDPENGQMKGVIARLEAILNSMYDGEEQQLADAIRKLDDDSDNKVDMLELARLLNTMENTGKDDRETCKRPSSKIAFNAEDRISPQNADTLISALLKLKGAKLSPKEAAIVAAFIRNRKGDSGLSRINGTSEKEIGKITSLLDSADKASKVTEALLHIRTLKLNSHERSDIAELVRCMGKRKGKYADSIQEAIAELRKSKMNPRQAKEVSRIMFNLRTAKRSSHYDINNSKDMMNLKKIMTPKNADMVAEVFKTVQDLDVNEREIDELAKSVADMGVEPLEPDAYQVVGTDHNNNHQCIVLNIPDGEEYAKQLENLHNSDRIIEKQVYRSRVFRLVVDLDDSDDSDGFACDVDSEFEEESNVEMESEDDDNNRQFQKAPFDTIGARDNHNSLETGQSFEAASNAGINSDSESSQRIDGNELPGGGGRIVSAITLSQDLHDVQNQKEDVFGNDKEMESKSIEKNSKISPPGPPVETPPTTNGKKEKTSKNIKLHHYGRKQDEAELIFMAEEEREKKIRFLNKHHWRHKKHNGTVVQEKRWRVDEDFDVDEVIWSPLTPEQYDRRKTIGSAILKSMDQAAPLDDIILSEFEHGKDNNERNLDSKKSRGRRKSKGSSRRNSVL